jgi:hypothetical protein
VERLSALKESKKVGSDLEAVVRQYEGDVAFWCARCRPAAMGEVELSTSSGLFSRTFTRYWAVMLGQLVLFYEKRYVGGDGVHFDHSFYF